MDGLLGGTAPGFPTHPPQIVVQSSTATCPHRVLFPHISFLSFFAVFYKCGFVGVGSALFDNTARL